MPRRVYLAIPLTVAAFAQTPCPAFEVASVKPAIQPQSPLARFFGTMPLSLKTRDPGRLKIASRSLRDIIAAAFEVQPLQVSGPAWMDNAQFDIEAKIPEGQTSQIAEMLRNLEERFALKLHRESRIVPGYELVAAKGGPKFESAQPVVDSSQMDMEERKKLTQDMMKETQKSLQKRAMENPRTGTWGPSAATGPCRNSARNSPAKSAPGIGCDRN